MSRAEAYENFKFWAKMIGVDLRMRKPSLMRTLKTGSAEPYEIVCFDGEQCFWPSGSDEETALINTCRMAVVKHPELWGTIKASWMLYYKAHPPAQKSYTSARNAARRALAAQDKRKAK